MQFVDVDVPGGAARKYEVVIGISLPAAVADDLVRMLEAPRWAVITDTNVGPLYGEPLAEALRQAGARADCLMFPAGEEAKTRATVGDLQDRLIELGHGRDSWIVAVGGGVVGDLAGFVAATLFRGVPYVQVPTTLLAMVDSSVGGKTGINLPGAKNMVGAFWQPSLVLIDTDVLTSLPDRSYLSGLAEVIKYGVIDDAEFFSWLESNAKLLAARDGKALRHAIQKSCECKAHVVGEDERETSGRRAILNYGHTFAHAIEATTGYGTLLHGEAVSIGMQMAARLAIDLQMAHTSLLERQTALLEACGLPTRLENANPDEMLPVMMRDKKVAHGNLRFILPTEIGVVDLVGGIDEAAVRQAILATI
jgi:3-dehydroquinate synthase